MKHILLILVFIAFISGSSNAQNYQCILPNAKQYFINSNNYLRGISIDSVKVSGTDTVYYPFRTPRGNFFTKFQDSGSWVGEQVIALQNGTYLFQNIWNDTITINSQAALYDSWILHSDTLGVYFEATVTRIDTVTVLSILDSVKTITITAKDISGVLTNNPITGKQIILSKAHGFVQVFNLYFFPYREPGTSNYTLPKGYDDFYDVAGQSYFKLINFHNPTMKEMYDYSVGDILLYIDSVNWYNPTFTLDEVVSNNTINRTIKSSVEPQPYGKYTTSTGIQIFITDSSLFFKDMPESNSLGWSSFHYIQNDTSFCKKSDFYSLRMVHYHPGAMYLVKEYKAGIGETFYGFQATNTPEHFNRKLQFYKISNSSCGWFKFPVSVKDKEVMAVGIYPNPAQDYIIIEGAKAGTSIKISDVLGRTIHTGVITTEKQVINTTSFTGGAYFLQLTDSMGVTTAKTFIKEQ